jgi:hypothetical protein
LILREIVRHWFPDIRLKDDGFQTSDEKTVSRHRLKDNVFRHQTKDDGFQTSVDT